MTAHQTKVSLTTEQQERADRFVRLLIATRTRIGGLRPASRRSLALQLALSPTMMNRYESGQIDPAEVRFGVVSKLAQVLGVSLAAVGMYLLQGRLQGLLEHPSMKAVAHLLAVDHQAVHSADSDETPAWAIALRNASAEQRSNAALGLMQIVAARMLDLGGASIGRAALLDRMTEGLRVRGRTARRKQFEQQLVGLMMGQLPTEPDFWQALAKPSVGLIAPSLEPGGTPEVLLGSLGLIEPQG